MISRDSLVTVFRRGWNLEAIEIAEGEWWRCMDLAGL